MIQFNGNLAMKLTRLSPISFITYSSSWLAKQLIIDPGKSL